MFIQLAQYKTGSTGVNKLEYSSTKWPISMIVSVKFSTFYHADFFSCYLEETEYPSPVVWEKTSNDQVPDSAVRGGTDASGELMFVGRACMDGDCIPGKVCPTALNPHLKPLFSLISTRCTHNPYYTSWLYLRPHDVSRMLYPMHSRLRLTIPSLTGRSLPRRVLCAVRQSRERTPRVSGADQP